MPLVCTAILLPQVIDCQPSGIPGLKENYVGRSSAIKLVPVEPMLAHQKDGRQYHLGTAF